MWKNYPFPDEEWFDNGKKKSSRFPKYFRDILPKVWGLWLLLFVALLASLAFPSFARFYTDYLWFKSLGHGPVFWTMLLPKWALFILSALVSFSFLFLNFRIARHNTLQLITADSPFGNVPKKFTSVVVLSASGILAILNGLSTQRYWDMILRYLHSSSFGSVDPIFGKEMAFYIYKLPFLSFLQTWFMGLLILALVGAGFMYSFVIAPIVMGQHNPVPRTIFKHLSLLAATIALLWGAGFWLERFNLLYSPRGVAFGASYTDIHAELLALNVMWVLAIIVALLLAVGHYKKTWKFSLGIIGLLFASSLLLRGVYPSIIQKYVVEPNEFDKERPYIEYNIDATLKAYKLDSLKTVSVVPESEVTWPMIDKNKETIQNVRLWDYDPLLRSFKQLQEIRSYYDFIDVDIDRYTFNGDYRQVMVAARELDFKNLQNPTWVNQRVEFTHGYGIVMNPVNEVGRSGLPALWIENIPPHIAVPIELNRPQIYYGEKPSSYVFVKTTEKEFDYPIGDSNARTTYEGSGGVSIGNFARRLLFALRFGDSKILFTNFFTPESRVLYYRNIQERLQRLAPFLFYDEDPYLVIHEGHLVWMQDAYTVTDRYPYAEPVLIGSKERQRNVKINYIRNSVKATVDAYDGTVHFYISDEKDPLIKTWAQIFPGLFQPMSHMPEGLKKHIRYPKDLFSVQSEILKIYHMQDPNTFYNKEDVWQTYKGSGNKEELGAFYVIMKIEEDQSAEFALITPFTPVGRDNMIAWMAGRCDGDRYGELFVYTFPKQKLIYGPAQVEALTNQHPDISAQLSLWSQRGSDVIKGNIIVIPIEKAVLYVQPLYLKAENSDLPELKQVIVSTGGRVVWAERLDEALEKLLGKREGVAVPSKVVSPERPADVTKPAEGIDTTQKQQVRIMIEEAQKTWETAQEALRLGDWAQYGEAMKHLETLLQSLYRSTQE